MKFTIDCEEIMATVAVQEIEFHEQVFFYLVCPNAPLKLRPVIMW